MRRICGWMILILMFAAAPTYAQQNSDWQLVAKGFTYVTAIVQPPHDPSRLFIADLQGTISIVQNGNLLPTPFLDIHNYINGKVFGQGLIGMAFDPDFAQNGNFYVAYTNADNWPVLSRYHVSSDLNLADPLSEQIILKVDHASPEHNGGDIAFGSDGYLYWAIGDGAYKRSPSQNLQSHLGAVLRLDVEHGTPYTIPLNNPYLNGTNALPELWAKGLRNPWRISFDRLTGDLYIADVGEAQREEIDFQPAGRPGGQNYGWNLYEGTVLFNGGSKAGLTFPVVEYSHDNGNCAITGGYVYRGTVLPDLAGKYVFADYCSGILWTTYQKSPGSWYTAQLMTTRYRITTFGEDDAGELYIGDVNNGSVYRLISTD